MIWQALNLPWQKIREFNELYLGHLSGMKPCASLMKPSKLFIVICVLIILILMYYIWFVKLTVNMRWGIVEEPSGKATETSVCKRILTEDTITKVQNSKTFLVSAYLDLRGSRLVRILGITYRNEPDSLLCDFCSIHYNYSNYAELQVHADHFGFPYGTTDLLCNIQDGRDPEYVSVYQANDPAHLFLKIQNTNIETNELEPKFHYNFLVCISAMFDAYNNVLQFIQSMEMYRMLGAEKVILYYTESSPLMKDILSYYKDFVELIPWPITSFINVSRGWHYPEHPGDLHYFGQTAALNDCVYRNMYKSKYIALNDIDELIVPITYKDWPEMLDSFVRTDPTTNVFIFENHLFPTTPQDKSNFETPEEWLSVPGVNILNHVYREPNLPSEINPTKMIINPRSVVRVSVHVPLEFTGNQYQVPSDFAKLCHYREPKQKDLDRSLLHKDNILSRYEPELIEKVNRVLSDVRKYIKNTPDGQE
ncbi:beta-1,4-galactosyltransferase galt-1-like [Hyla sarda]|uniref:beta-1,4-galactosyltransferase galt-1-like n=1 Tax=Hyla sarda TaxID=327740 RepID=UPI0024C244EF|nr:beta-1,4-galactosyltransferase galt-1-like [Hyla sarda]XP_056394120.1 beta-1,4-galactosyltransferase galt-1-like [Hyla sarda]XP_056394121.1 beta-1,4-galactosyltransferase galt-1-like [Hyla sarda]XP_056394122.1 beta-1,4-galactosyltransferase galt-1-like [Hyla sarda]XP_056394123.1 beta-1,4-galactosyltransferase galt-1-like [Hyla sarda]XP_056394124.1 beta-1,4-galactosyltransferase galt-1-like [Hyla sarda]